MMMSLMAVTMSMVTGMNVNECVDSLVVIYDYSEEVDDDDVDDYMAKTIPVFIMMTGRREEPVA